jgi:hypothetical protein
MTGGHEGKRAGFPLNKNPTIPIYNFLNNSIIPK